MRLANVGGRLSVQTADHWMVDLARHWWAFAMLTRSPGARAHYD